MIKASIGIFLGLVVVMLALTWLSAGNDLLMFKTFAPRQEAIRRETFEQSKAYSQGTIQQIDQARRDYAKGGPEEKAAIKSMILHETADFDLDRLPIDDAVFIQQLRSQP